MGDYEIPWAKPYFDGEELEEVKGSFETGWLSMGKKVRKFEKVMAELVGARYAVAVANGTVALDLAMKALEIERGDEVIVPAMTYFASASTVSYQGATPVFVDIDPTTFNLDPIRIEEAITTKTKAILFIDYGGNPAAYDQISQIAKAHGIPLLQDAAQSLGAVYKGAAAGAQAPVSTMSFHLAKVMTCVEGGMVFSDSLKMDSRLRTLRNLGEPPGEKYTHVALGTNARMTDISAGIGLAQARKLPFFLAERNRVAEHYDELFSASENGVKKVKTPKIQEAESRNAYFFYPVLLDSRDQIAQDLRAKFRIDTRIAYPVPVYGQPIYKSQKLPFRKMACPVAEDFCKKVLNLPIFPGMSSRDIEKVVGAVSRLVSSE